MARRATLISMARPLLRRRAGEGKALAVTQGKGGQGPCCDAGQRGADLNAWADALGGNVLRSGAQALKYSENWKAKFMDCQKKVNQQDGSQGCNLTHILRHFSFRAVSQVIHLWKVSLAQILESMPQRSSMLSDLYSS